MKLSPDTVAEGWIDLHSRKMSKSEREVSRWAEEAVSLAIGNDADYAFEIIEAIQGKLPDTSKVLEQFAAGPLEDLLSYQGVIVIDRVEKKARRDLGFARSLGGVWQGGMIDDVWERIKLCRDTSVWADVH